MLTSGGHKSHGARTVTYHMEDNVGRVNDNFRYSDVMTRVASRPVSTQRHSRMCVTSSPEYDNDQGRYFLNDVSSIAMLPLVSGDWSHDLHQVEDNRHDFSDASHNVSSRRELQQSKRYSGPRSSNYKYCQSEAPSGVYFQRWCQGAGAVVQDTGTGSSTSSRPVMYTRDQLSRTIDQVRSRGASPQTEYVCLPLSHMSDSPRMHRCDNRPEPGYVLNYGFNAGVYHDSVQRSQYSTRDSPVYCGQPGHDTDPLGHHGNFGGGHQLTCNRDQLEERSRPPTLMQPKAGRGFGDNVPVPSGGYTGHYTPWLGSPRGQRFTSLSPSSGFGSKDLSRSTVSSQGTLPGVGQRSVTRPKMCDTLSPDGSSEFVEAQLLDELRRGTSELV